MQEMPAARTIPQLIDEQAHRFGTRAALVAGADRLSYVQLRAAVRRTARGLIALGVGKGDHVAILMGNRSEWVIAFLAVEQLGATAVALNTWATERELEYALNHADVGVLIATDRYLRHDYRARFAALPSLAAAFPKLRRIVWLPAGSEAGALAAHETLWDDLATLATGVPEAAVDAAASAVGPDDVALLLYTSGSTAAPKGILLQHGHWISNAFQIGERQHVTAADRLWLTVSLFWSFGCVNALPNLLTHGACVVLQESFDAAVALELIERERCTLFYGTPNIVQALAAHPDRARRDLSSLRSGALIGSPEQLMQAVELGLKSFCNIYGLSETYGNCAVTDAADPLEVRLHSVGRPLPGVTLRICHLVTGAPLPAGEVGEIRVRGPLVLAYYKDEEKTREAFDTDGYFRTGDLGLLDADGRLYFRGRCKEMVKSGGINVAPIEIEEVLLRHPKVQSAFVVGVPDAVLDEALAAAIIPKDGVTLTRAEVIAFCKQELAAYKVPQHVRFVTYADLPLTTTGKLQKMKLPELFKDDPGRAS